MNNHIMRYIVLVLMTWMLTGCNQQDMGHAYLFSYFTGNGEDGLHLAWSTDGLHWEVVNNGRSLLLPLVGESVLMRDPCIAQGPDGRFHMVWTTSWNGRTIGYASSSDLIDWSVQKAIPVMEHEPDAANCWAPEITYSPEMQKFMIYWSTTIPGRFPETAAGTPQGDRRNHRIYYTTTSDFEHFEETRLLYEPGFNVIDASIYKVRDGYMMLLKDETELPDAQKNIRVAHAGSIEGPYGPASDPITGDYWAEGPTGIQIDGQWYVYFDKYRKQDGGVMGVVVSEDLQDWADWSEKLTMPPGARHGTVLRVGREMLDRLLALDKDVPVLYRDISRKGRPYAKDPSVVRFGDKYWMYFSLPPLEKDGERIGGWNIGIAVSDDLKHWQKAGEILPAGQYESKGLCAPCAKVIDGKIHLFYQTYGNRENDAICHAWSEDGIQFARNSTNPIFAPTGAWNVGRAIDADLLIHNDTAYLYWATRDPEFEQQMLGVSTAPVSAGFARDSWKQVSEQPMLQPELPWEKNCIEAASVFREQDAWYMFYAGAYNHEGQQIGLAKSNDGIHWQRVSDNPVLPHGKEYAWNSWESGHPGVFIDEDGAKYLFYQGNPDGGYTYYLSHLRFDMANGNIVYKD
jgi:predicted GH43/DUF377 family glycosyl hydrolase